MSKKTMFIQSYLSESEYQDCGYFIHTVIHDVCWEERCENSWLSPTKEAIFLSEQEVEVDIPEFDAREKLLASLEGKKRDLMAKYQRDKASIEDKISKLLALDHLDG
jgi:hypothetical protein